MNSTEKFSLDMYNFYWYFFNVYTQRYTEILEVNLFAFAYRLFHEDFSPVNGTVEWREIFELFSFLNYI